MKTGIGLIAKERKEQINKHGRTIERDMVDNKYGQLMVAVEELIRVHPSITQSKNIIPFGWDINVWDKMRMKSRLDRLIIAGALIAAEIDRLLVNKTNNYD